MAGTDPQGEDETRGRWFTLARLEVRLERPMLVLSLIWLILVVVELIWGSSGIFEFVGTAIWIIFILEFLLRFALAPDKVRFLRRNPVTLIALVAPAFRFVRALRFLRIARSLRLVRVVGTANRGLSALQRSFDRRGLRYVLVATTFVILLGAAGMFAFERAGEQGVGLTSYPDALWWTAMLVSTMGSEFWPRTAEGRVLALLLSIYGLAVFGYVTASFASFFVGQDAQSESGEIAGSAELKALRHDIMQLRAELARIRPAGDGDAGAGGDPS